MQAHWWWWGVAVLLGVAEMLTGTFFLLVLGLGFAAGGAMAVAGAGLAWQLVSAAFVSFVGWYLLRRKMPRRERLAAHSSRDVLLDIGERVRVEHWQPDRRAQVSYRGATWTAELADGEARSGEFVIRRIEGNRLIVSPAA
jgi:membrane protein implicated in regulation of membrane protease activity